MANDRQDRPSTHRARAPAAPATRAEIDAFLARVKELAPATEAGRRGRLIFALDATMSRQPLWDTACKLQADMFREAAAIGGLDVQLVYYRGLGECRASQWVSQAERLAALMERIDCRGGHTQIGKIIAHARRETERVKVHALALWALNAFTKVNPHTAAAALKTGGGLGALALAGVLGVRGRLDIAIPLGLTGLGLLGWLPWSIPGFGARTQKSAGQVSRVRSAFMEMELDHDTGAMRGRILAGRHEGAALDALDVATLTGFLPEIDEESRSLLMAYLDRREPAWREHAQGDAASGAHRRAWSGGKMTEEEAYQILGVEPGASAEDIGRAHRALMKKLHPDQGGSTYLAARVNEAKEVLLRRHR